MFQYKHIIVRVLSDPHLIWFINTKKRRRFSRGLILARSQNVTLSTDLQKFLGLNDGEMKELISEIEIRILAHSIWRMYRHKHLIIRTTKRPKENSSYVWIYNTKTSGSFTIYPNSRLLNRDTLKRYIDLYDEDFEKFFHELEIIVLAHSIWRTEFV